MTRTYSENGGSRVPQNILNDRPERKRSTERQRLRWLDDVGNDVRNMGVRQCRKKAENRQKLGRSSEGGNG
jgi:hypothetical protein